MEHLFRFVLTRPADTRQDRSPPVLLAQDTDFQAALAEALARPAGKREAIKQVARNYTASSDFVGSDSGGAFAEALAAMDAALDQLETNETVTNAAVSEAISDAFGRGPAALRDNGTLGAAISPLKDSLVAIKLLPEEHRRPVQQLTDQLRNLEVIGAVLEDTSFPGTGAALRAFRRRPVKLPGDTELKSILSTRERQRELAEQQKAEDEERRKAAEERLDLYKRLTRAVDELVKLSADDVQTGPQEGRGGFMPPADVRPLKLLVQDMALRQNLTKVDLTTARDTEPPRERETAALPLTAFKFQREVLPAMPRMLPGSPVFKPVTAEMFGFRLKETASKHLSDSTQELLKQRGLVITAQALDDIVRILRTELAALSNELDISLGRAVDHTLKRIGTRVVMISTPAASAWNQLVVGNLLESGFIPFPFPLDTRVPSSHGNVAPAGVADLLVVKQQLVGYEGADVAHIENVLKGESKSREHTTRRETEQFSFIETELTTTEERELESTTRFEMSQETSKTIKADAAVKGGLSLSGKYGPTVEFSASAEASFSTSKQEATKSALSFSQDVTERSANKVIERVLERASLKVTNEVIEKNTHGIDNTTGGGHISGVYQWVNKVYQAQMFNYGIRMMYDFMVPQPAAFLISSMQRAHANALELTKPTPFTLRPDQIYESNYSGWAQQYGASDVEPPPEMYVTKSHNHDAGADERGVEFHHSTQIAIDDGYRAIHATIGCVRMVWEDEWAIDVVIGARSHRFNQGSAWVWGTSLDSETGTVPLGVVTLYAADFALAVEIKCVRTDRALKKWQVDTWAKLNTAFRARMAEYEEKLKALEVQAGVQIRGMNPLLNMEMMKDELKKHCLSILTEQHFDLFDAVQIGGGGVEQIDLYQNEAEGPYVRFFEQAFEWEQMTWLTYPYFWAGPKGEWRDRIAYDDPDPVFNQFLKAGYCRAVVPVRPGFESAVDHFTTYGEIWSGGPLPAISNPLYLPIAEEIAERLDRPGQEIPQGDPWLVRIPTTLVKLRPDDKLPVWQQNAQGDWVEA